MNKIKLSWSLGRIYILTKNAGRIYRLSGYAVKVTGGYSFLSYFKKNDSVETKDPMLDIIAQADMLFEQEKYLDLYLFLLEYKDDENVEILWRICRALYRLARSPEYDELSKHMMIFNAYEVLCDCLKITDQNAQVHKWMAVILDAKLRYENIFTKSEDVIRTKNHLTEAYKLAPDDSAVIYMLGQWYYKMSSLTWFQKRLVTLFCPDLPSFKYEDALNYFLKAEEVKPRYYLVNIYMLGKINYKLGNMYRAHYYLNIAAQMTPNSKNEEKCVVASVQMLKRLKRYDVSEEAL